MPTSLSSWLAAGSVAEADWEAHVRRLALHGGLGYAADGLLLDLPALAQPHACRPATCAPGLRAAGSRSCCADLDVELTEPEVDALTVALPELTAFLAPRDPRWAGGAPDLLEGPVLRRPGGRCVFAATGPHGLACGLHALEDATGRARGTLKPMPCRLFPLVVVDLGEERTLLTAVHRTTARHVGLPPRRFPCLLSDDRASLVRSARDTLEELWGPATARAIARAVRAYAPVETSTTAR